MYKVFEADIKRSGESSFITVVEEFDKIQQLLIDRDSLFGFAYDESTGKHYVFNTTDYVRKYILENRKNFNMRIVSEKAEISNNVVRNFIHDYKKYSITGLKLLKIYRVMQEEYNKREG